MSCLPMEEMKFAIWYMHFRSVGVSIKEKGVFVVKTHTHAQRDEGVTLV